MCRDEIVFLITIPIPFLSTSSYVNIIHFYIYEVPFIYFVSLLYCFKFLALYFYDCVSLFSFMLIFICCWLWCCYVPRWVLNYHLDLTWEVPLGRRSPISSRHLGTFYVLAHIMLWEDGKPRTWACKPRTRINEKRSSQKGAHLGRFCQGILRANMITQLQNSRRLACLRNPRILIHSWKGQGLAMKTTRHVTEER